MVAQYSYARYSPRNWLIVDWPFDSCSLPKPDDCPQDPESPAPHCGTLPIREAIDTYNWERWLPEVIVGIEDADDEIAANYIRMAAIDFAKRTRCLQRELVIPLEHGVDTYPLFPWPEERIVGVLGIRIEVDGYCRDACSCTGSMGVTPFGLQYRLDVRRNEITVQGAPSHGIMRVLVYSAPTEFACEHDVFLYDEFHSTITAMARLMYVQAVHYKDRALISSLTPLSQLNVEVMIAKRRSVRSNASTQMAPGSGMWQRGGGFRRW